MGAYDDMLHLSRPRSKRPPMAVADRAAQFAPFAALAGHREAVEEEARLTEQRRPLADVERRELDGSLQRLRSILPERPRIAVGYFVEDPLKEGGAYVQHEGALRAIDDVRGMLVFQDGREVPLAAVDAMEVRRRPS